MAKHVQGSAAIGHEGSEHTKCLKTYNMQSCIVLHQTPPNVNKCVVTCVKKLHRFVCVMNVQMGTIITKGGDKHGRDSEEPKALEYFDRP